MPMEPPMVTLRECTGLYTSVGDHEDQTLNEGFKSMSILDPNEARDTSSLNIRVDGLRRPNSKSYTDTPKRTNSRLTIPEKPEEPRQFNAAFEQVLDHLENNAYQAGMRAASRSASRLSSRASSVSSTRSTRSRKMHRNDTVGGNTVAPGNASTGGKLPMFTQTPPPVPASMPVPVSVSVPMPVRSCCSVPYAVPSMPCTVPNVSILPPNVSTAHAQSVPVHVPMCAAQPHYTTAAQSTAPRSSFNIVTQPMPQVGGSQFYPSQPRQPIQPRVGDTAFYLSLPVPWNVLPEPGMAEMFKESRKVPGFIIKFNGTSSYAGWRRMFISQVHLMEIPVPMKVRVMISSLDSTCMNLINVINRLVKCVWCVRGLLRWHMRSGRPI